MQPSAMALLTMRRRARNSAAAFAGAAAIAALVLAAGSAPALAQTQTGTQNVSYAGYHFEVPASWPVYDLSQEPSTCVRFDVHAVYLGSAAANEKCPSWLLGATEALLIGPGPSTAGKQTTENPVSHLITATAPGLIVTATFDTDSGAITDVLASAGLATAITTTADRVGTTNAPSAPPGWTPSYGS